MTKDGTLKVVLGLVGAIFSALIVPMFLFVRQAPALSMTLSLYATLGVFLLLAVRSPRDNRTLIGFTAWSSLVHGVLMGTQALTGIVSRQELVGVSVLLVIGIVLIALAPATQPASHTSAIALPAL